MNGAAISGISFKSSPDEKDWISAQWLVIRRRWLWRRLLIAVILVWAAYFVLIAGNEIWTFGWPTDGWQIWTLSLLVVSASYSLGVSAVLILITVGLTPRRVRKTVKDSKRLAPETHFDADEVGIQTRNAISANSVAWSKFERWLENRQVFVLMLTQSLFFIIRKSDLEPGAADQLRSLLIAVNVPSR